MKKCTSERKLKNIGFALLLMLGILCLLYGLVIVLAGSGTTFFLVWFGLGILFMILALLKKKNLFGKVPRKLKNISFILLLVCLIIFLITEGLIASHFSDRGEQNADYLIVLGAQVWADGPSPVLRFRLDSAVRYLEENPDSICIVTGGQGYNEPFTEAEGMRDYLLTRGISEDRILMENQSKNTVENLRNCLTFLDEKKDTVCIVTNDFHLFRAMHLAEGVGYEKASGLAAPSSLPYLPNNMLREFLGVWKDLMVGNFLIKC